MGAFQMIWMWKEPLEQFSLQAGRQGGQVGGHFGQQATRSGAGAGVVSAASSVSWVSMSLRSPCRVA